MANQGASPAVPTDARGIAEQIVDDLFVNGSGQKAARLVLMTEAGRDIGGWGRVPVYDRIARAIQSALTDAETRGRQAGGWQDISAYRQGIDPKDVLLWWPHWSNRPTVGYWKHGRWIAEDALSDLSDVPGPVAWMPLSAPPVATEARPR